MRQGTASNITGESGFVAVGDVNEINVSERPVTQHELSGIKTQGQGPGRRVYDRSYFINLILSKNSELAKEIQQFRNEIDELQKEQSQ